MTAYLPTFARPRRRNLGCARAFTLVELLVVLGVVLVLIGVLLPSLRAARRSAQQVACAAKLRQIGAAFFYSANDRRGYLPLAGTISISMNSATAGDGFELARQLNDPKRQYYRYTYVADSFNQWSLMPWPVSIATYLAPSQQWNIEDWNSIEPALNGRDGIWKHLMCPATDSYNYGNRINSKGESVPTFQGTVLKVTTPGFGYLWSTNTDYVINEGVFGWSANPARRRLRGRLSRITNPDTTVLLTDGSKRPDTPFFELVISPMGTLSFVQTGTTDGEQFWTPTTIDPRVAVTLAGPLYNQPSFGGTAVLPGQSRAETATSYQSFDLRRHNGRVNILCADGHVETRRINRNDLDNLYLLPPVK